MSPPDTAPATPRTAEPATLTPVLTTVPATDTVVDTAVPATETTVHAEHERTSSRAAMVFMERILQRLEAEL